MVNELPMSTTVLMRPQEIVIEVLAATNASWYQVR